MTERNQLQAAHTAVTDLQATVAKLEAAFERANVAVADAEQKLNEVSSSGSDLVQQRIAQLKNAEGFTP